MMNQTSLSEPRFGAKERSLILGVVMKILRDQDQAEDAAQDAMLLAYRHRASFRGDARFSTWLYRIAATTALMHLRKQRSRHARNEVSDPAVYETLLAPGFNPEEKFLVDEAVAHARRRLGRMGKIYGRAVSMQLAEGYSSAEIGKELGLPPSTVTSRVHRGRAALRAALRKSPV
jgi:RNA polymerase sigma-70 factor, ECF subfamily